MKNQEYLDTWTLGFDKRCAFISRFKSYIDYSEENGYKKRNEFIPDLHNEILPEVKKQRLNEAILPAVLLIATYSGISLEKNAYKNHIKGTRFDVQRECVDKDNAAIFPTST